MIHARMAQASDAPGLKILNDLFNGEGSNSLAQIEQSLKGNEQELVCVAVEGDRLVGFCCGQIFKSMCYSSHYGEVTELFVLASHRRQGVASRLMTFIESEFRQRGIHHFQLFTGRENNAAQALYMSLGYSETSEMMLRKRPPEEKE